MCLLLVAWRAHPDWPLIVAGNRDEFHSRPTRAAHWWPDLPEVLGGRDLVAGGTWLAVHRDGRFAAVTNYRDAVRPAAALRSRGGLVTQFLRGELAPPEYAEAIDGDQYGGFNLIAGSPTACAYRSNRGAGSRRLAPGIYAVANATLDTPWPKVTRSKARLASLLDAGRVGIEPLFELLLDREPADGDETDTGELPAATASALSAAFVVLPEYGTRSTSVLLGDAGGRLRFAERCFDANGRETGRSDFEIEAQPA